MLFGYGFFGAVTKTMVTFMNKHSDCNSDSDDSDTPANNESNFKHMSKHSNKTNFKPTLKSKILGPISKDNMQSFS